MPICWLGRTFGEWSSSSERRCDVCGVGGWPGADQAPALRPRRGGEQVAIDSVEHGGGGAVDDDAGDGDGVVVKVTHK